MAREGVQVEVTLYDRRGRASAYIDMEDDYTVYLWDGTPVAYVVGENVYGFNGRHLGWFEEGVLFDRFGHSVGFTGKTCPTETEEEPPRSAKETKPGKRGMATPPMKPLFSSTPSFEDFELFLKQGQ